MITPQTYLKIKKQQEAFIDKARERIIKAYNSAYLCPVPKNIRKATARDIVEDAIIWYPDWDEGKWCVVEEVLRAGDDFKAFTAEGGDRYGLDGAYVEED